MEKTLEDLESYKHRIEGDIRRIRLVDPDGLSRTSPLFKNYEKVIRDIETMKENKG